MFNRLLKKFPLLPVIFISIILTVIILLPIFQAGYIGDDTVFYARENPSLWQAITSLPQELNRQITGGRLHLGTFFTTHWLVLVTNNLFATHLLTIILTSACIVAFACLLKKLKLPNLAIGLTVLLLPFLWQIRSYHDVFLIYYGSFQLFFLLFVLSAIFFLNFLRSNKKIWAILAIFFFFVIAGAHEANIMFLPCLVVIFWLQERKFISLKCWPLIVDAVLAIFSMRAAQIMQLFSGRAIVQSSYQALTTDFSPLTIIKAWLTQSVAALPLNTFFGRTGQEALSYHQNLALDNLPFLILLVVILASVAVMLGKLSSADKKEKSARLTWFLFILFGILLVVCSALPIAVSSRYQNEVVLFGMKGGVAYLMVFYEYFGVALLLGLLLYFLLSIKFLRRITYVAMTIILSFVFYQTYLTNIAIVREINKAYDDQRWLIGRGIEAGFFANLENQKSLNFFFNPRPNNYYYLDSNRSPIAIQLQNYLSQYHTTNISYCSNNDVYLLTPKVNEKQKITCAEWLLQNPNLNNYFVYYDQIDENTGYIVLAKVTDFNDGLLLGDEVNIYYVSSHLNNNHPGGIYPVLRRDLYTTYYVLDANNQPQLKQNRQWLTRDRENNFTVVNFKSAEPVLLDSVVPQLVQDDRSSWNAISPVK